MDYENEAARALVAAQKEMGRAHKGEMNPHFRKNYASLGNVMDACYPALHSNGFAVIQPQGRDENGDYVETVFLHESGAQFSTRVYLLLEKQSMQGKGSAITYARRYGLIALAGLADTDDDGNEASKPRQEPAPSQHPRQSAPQQPEKDPHEAWAERVMECVRKMRTCASLQELKSFWDGLHADFRAEEAVIKAKDEMKSMLEKEDAT